MHRGTGRFANGEQSRHGRIRIAVARAHHFAVQVGGDAAHIVVRRGEDRDRLAGEVDAGEDARRLGDAGQPLGEQILVEMAEMEMHVILVGAGAAAFADLDGDGARDHVARGEILGVRRIALHEALAFGIGEEAAFAARAFGDQHAGAVDAGRVELHELHVLERQPGAQAPWRCRRRCRYARTCRRNRRGHSRRWRGSPDGRGSGAACRPAWRAPPRRGSDPHRP